MLLVAYIPVLELFCDDGFVPILKYSSFESK